MRIEERVVAEKRMKRPDTRTISVVACRWAGAVMEGAGAVCEWTGAEFGSAQDPRKTPFNPISRHPNIRITDLHTYGDTLI